MPATDPPKSTKITKATTKATPSQKKETKPTGKIAKTTEKSKIPAYTTISTKMSTLQVKKADKATIGSRKATGPVTIKIDATKVQTDKIVKTEATNEMKTSKEAESEGMKRVKFGKRHESTLNFDSKGKHPSAVDTAEATSLIINMKKTTATLPKTTRMVAMEVDNTNAREAVQKGQTQTAIDNMKTDATRVTLSKTVAPTSSTKSLILVTMRVANADDSMVGITRKTKPLSRKNEMTEKITEEILNANAPTLKFESKEAGNDEMKITKRPTLYVAPWNKSIKSIDKTNPTSSAFKFSSTYISVALTHIMAAIIVLMS